MKNRISLICLAAGSLVAVTAGCGKTENPSAPAPPADTATSAAKPEPTPTAQEPAAQSTNAVAAAAGAAETTLATGASALTEAASNQVPNQAQASLESLSRDQMVRGLQEALAKGLQQAIARLGHDGGFLTNLNVRIPMPEKLQKVETVLRTMKQDKLADDFVATMNHAAELAVPEAGSVFGAALKQLTIEDARSILSGPNDAATQYFQKTTQTNLYARFYPIVQKATEQTGVTAAYKNLTEKATGGQSLGGLGGALGGTLLGKDSMDIDAYVTNKAMDGLFKMVAEEEQRIRQNPLARTTDLLQQVFGALKR